MADFMLEASFPVSALLPKAETGVLNFLQKYPEFDGRDTTIAIFDSGVDPCAAGLATLCDGKSVKVIERFDCTGAGDVDTSEIVTADQDNLIEGVTGRLLKLTPKMIAANVDNGKYHVGSKILHDLLPSRITENLLNVTKTKTWDGPHKTSVAAVVRKINEFDSQNSETTKLPWDKKFVKENLDGILDILNHGEKQYFDIKTTYDCVLYKTQDGWQVVIDTTEKGDLENALHIGEYSRTHEMKKVDDYLSISVNVHDEGKVLEVVGMCSSHGTHVAAIASGYHSDQDLNGVAPNAKIVSLTIGDNRLGSMETGTALVRAMMKVMEMCQTGRKIDVINMSYGEHAHWSNTGRLGKLMNEIVNKYGVVWIASAGNHGPALCTVGTPPDISEDSCIGVGAYVSPQMMDAEYALREKLPANLFTWSSRGPCIDGGEGVTICAPGGAVTSVPQFNMCKSQFMNGTSMASPHVAGAIALLISGLKQRGIEYSPFSIRRAIANTATKVSYADPFAQGHGLLNIEKAFEYMVQNKDAVENKIKFIVAVGNQNAKGIHIREGLLQRGYEFSVLIDPLFFNEIDAPPEDKVNFNIRLTFVPTQPWVQCGSFIDLSYTSRSFVVKIDPIGLPPGVHTANIHAYDSECVQKGPLFNIPVTVVQPFVLKSGDRCFEPESNRADGSIEFKANTIRREFILVPKGATWAVLRMRSTDKILDSKDVGKFSLHVMQLLPRSSCRVFEYQKMINLNSESESVNYFKVKDNNIMELCVAKYWSSLGSTHVKYTLEFHGLQAINPNPFVMHAGYGIHKIVVSSFINEETQAYLQLKNAGVVLKPVDSKISPLSNTRDVIPDGRQIYQNILTYTLYVHKATEISVYSPFFSSLLYESEFESQLWMLFDCNKVLIVAGDAHSKSYFVKLEKGEYTIKLQVRHEKRDLLEKVSDTTLIATFKLNNYITIDTYDQYNQCLIGGKKSATMLVKENAARVLYIGPVLQEKLSKSNLPTNTVWLTGKISLCKDENARKAASDTFTYILNAQDNGKKNGGTNSNNSSSDSNSSSSIANNSSKLKSTASTATLGPSVIPSSAGDGATSVPSVNGNSPGSPKKTKSSEEDYNEGLRDFQCSMITKCNLEKAEKIYAEVIEAHPKHLLAHILLIQNIESTDLKTQFPLKFTRSIRSAEENGSSKGLTKEGIDKIRVSLERIIQLADIVFRETDKDALLAYYGLKYDSRPDAAKIKTNMDKQRGNLLEALTKKGIAIAKLAVINDNLKIKLEDLDSICLEILKFVDATDTKVVQFSIWHAFAHEQYGRMCKYLTKLYDDKRGSDCLEEIYDIICTLKYDHLKQLMKRQLISGFPSDYRLF